MWDERIEEGRRWTYCCETEWEWEDKEKRDEGKKIDWEDEGRRRIEEEEERLMKRGWRKRKDLGR